MTPTNEEEKIPDDDSASVKSNVSEDFLADGALELYVYGENFHQVTSVVM